MINLSRVLVQTKTGAAPSKGRAEGVTPRFQSVRTTSAVEDEPRSANRNNTVLPSPGRTGSSKRLNR